MVFPQCLPFIRLLKILWLFSNYLMQEVLVQLMCNYYTLRQDGSRAYMRSWNLQVRTIFGIVAMFCFFWIMLDLRPFYNMAPITRYVNRCQQASCKRVVGLALLFLCFSLSKNGVLGEILTGISLSYASSGLFGWEDLDKLENTWEWPNSV